jgi:hypothetical protein
LANNNLGNIKASPLLLKYDYIDSEVDESDIKNSYPYELAFVNRDTLLTKVFNQSNVVYMEILPVLVTKVDGYRISFEHVFINASNGKVVGYLPYDIKQKFISIASLKKVLSGGNKMRNTYSGEERE